MIVTKYTTTMSCSLQCHDIVVHDIVVRLYITCIVCLICMGIMINALRINYKPGRSPIDLPRRPRTCQEQGWGGVYVCSYGAAGNLASLSAERPRS